MSAVSPLSFAAQPLYLALRPCEGPDRFFGLLEALASRPFRKRGVILGFPGL